MPYKDKEKEREYFRAYRRSHREQIRENHKKYRNQNRQWVNELSNKNKNKRRAKHKASGLCTECNNPVATGHIYCEKHLQEQSYRNRKLRANKKDIGLCHDCNNKSENGMSFCRDCLDKKAIKDKERYHNPFERQKMLNRCRNYYGRNRDFRISYTQNRMKSFINENKCAKCGAPLIEGEARYCFACIANRNLPISFIKGVLKYETAN